MPHGLPCSARRRPCSAAWCWPAGRLAVLGSVLAGRLPCPATASPRAVAARPCPWPTGQCCAPRTGSVLYLALIALLSLESPQAVRELPGRHRHRARPALPRPDHRPAAEPALAPPPSSRSARPRPAWTIQATTGLAACPSVRGVASACSPPGRRRPCWPAGWYSGCVTPERGRIMTSPSPAVRPWLARRLFPLLATAGLVAAGDHLDDLDRGSPGGPSVAFIASSATGCSSASSR